jgi:diketogulonate reductase-like aldo/keto reductase
MTFRYIPLPRSSKAERIRSNANVYDFNLSEAEMESLDKLDKGTDGAISWNPVIAD